MAGCRTTSTALATKIPVVNGWELMGEFNGFGGGPQYVLQNDGGGLYSVVVNGLAASDADGYAFKFRRHDGTAGNWDVNIGATFRNGGDDAKTGQIAAGNYKFELDLFNGRWRVVGCRRQRQPCGRRSS